ncbi:cuscuta receptor 1-like isoform X1 [Nicotiana tomentosiformis]|uniref:cuscuta receptor 1-like isoform X1 n=1 Tax=Nicotiana tomentosiformis TaxID=4098 RepID=UPI00051B3541
MTSKIVYWWLLILFIVNGWWCCYCCWKEERTALLQLKENINYTGGSYLPSWVANETSDCCQWEGIVCSNTTRRVGELAITVKKISQEEQLRTNGTNTDDMLKNWLFNASLFIPFKNLKALLLPGHSLAGWAKNEGFEKLRQLGKLEILDLSGNQFNRSIFQSLSQLSSLKSLNLSHNNIGSGSDIWFTHNKIGSGSERLSGLDKLEILDLSDNNLDDENLLSALELNTSRTALKKLDIRYNTFRSFIPNEELGALRNIEYLLLDGNTLDENFLRSSGVMSSLKVLSVANCMLNGILPLQGNSRYKRAARCTKLCYARAGKGQTTRVCCTQSYPAFLQEAVSTARTHDLLVTWQQLYELRQGSPSNFKHSIHQIILYTTNLLVHFIGLCDLKYLEELSLSGNSFTGKLPTCLGNLTFLRVFDLTINQFTGNIASSPLSSLLSLEYLLLANNNFEIPISFESFANHSKLKFVTADYNSVIVQTSSKSWIPKFQLEVLSLNNCSQMPSFLHYQRRLRLLRLSKCNIGGNFPNWLLENNPRLADVLLDGNAFTGSLELPLLPDLKAFDISNNKIQGQLPPNIGSIFPNLVISTMSNNMLEGMLPSSFGDMKDLAVLDLSYNKLIGDLPIGLARKGSKLNFLRLSYNMLKGEIFLISANINNLEYLYLDRNNFSGPTPQKLSTAPLITLDLSYNNLSGNVPAWLGNIPSLTSLALSRNHLKGHIPPDYCRLEGLEVLDLSDNNLVGVIPSCFNSSLGLKRVYLSKNKLQGEFNMFSNTDLKVLDLRDNNFSGSIPKWLGSTLEITTLLLKGNRLQGTIPTQLCHASNLRILDLSHNNLSGPIPHCLGSLMQIEGISEAYPYSSSFGYSGFQTFGGDTLINIESSIESSSTIFFLDNYAWVGAEFTTKYNTYSYEASIVDYMSGIDLSCNQLSGEIPKELSNLTEIRALNLSHNHITGTILSEFSKLQNIESLDLSYNNLTGRIPSQLVELTTLAIFSVAHNNLTGRTPQRTSQFATFTESSYEGNPFLCGPPLHNNCMETKEIPISPRALDCCEDDTGFLDMESFSISFLVAYANVVLVVVVVLCVNPYWRNVWFYFVESFMYSCYYFFASKM